MFKYVFPSKIYKIAVSKSILIKIYIFFSSFKFDFWLNENLKNIYRKTIFLYKFSSMAFEFFSLLFMSKGEELLLWAYLWENNTFCCRVVESEVAGITCDLAAGINS